jgi:soluble lytic murein transglycosylase-like protein
VNAYDPEQNIEGGARYLRDLMQMFGSDLSLALAAYNAGEGAVKRNQNRIPRIRETIEYVPKVLAHYRKNNGHGSAEAVRTAHD